MVEGRGVLRLSRCCHGRPFFLVLLRAAVLVQKRFQHRLHIGVIHFVLLILVVGQVEVINRALVILVGGLRAASEGYRCAMRSVSGSRTRCSSL